MKAPRWARFLLRTLVPPERLEDTLGDLEEVHRRRLRRGALWAWVATSAEAVGVASTFVGLRLRARGSAPLLPSLPEVRLALRLVRRQPVLNATAVLALATGLGLAGASFTLVDAFLFGRVPLPGGARFVKVQALADEDGRRVGLDRERFEALARDASTLAYLGAMADGTVNLLDADGAVEPLRGVSLSADAFRVLPYRPLTGRTLVAADGLPTAPPVVVIGERLWKRRFGADPAVLGRSVNLGGTRREVVGVLPTEAGFPNEPDLWTALSDDALLAGDGGSGTVFWGVLREGVSLEAASAQLQALGAGLDDARPGIRKVRLRAVPYTQVPQGGLAQALFGGMLAVIVAVLLVIAANVGNLVAARTAARRDELAVRTALGAARGRLVAQLFLEVLVIGGVAAALAWVGVEAAMRWVDGVADELPFWVDFTPGPATLAFMLAVTLATCLVAGVLPGLRATRTEPGVSLRAGARSGGGAPFGRGGAVMSVFQVAVSVALMGTALVAVRGLDGYARAPVGVDEAHVVTAAFAVPGAVGADAGRALLERVEDGVSGMPGAGAVGIATALPRMDPPAPGVLVEPLPGEEAGQPRPAPRVRARPGFLEALGAAPIAGRLLEREDLVPGAMPVAVVNASFVAKFFGGRNAVGRRIRVEGPDDGDGAWREIVGVVPDLGMSVGDPALAAGWYEPFEDASWVYLAMKVVGEPSTFVGPLRRAVADVDPDIILTRVRTLDRAASDNVTALAAIASGLSALGGMALLLSLVSTWALVAFTVSRRVREIGVRVALGAGAPDVIRSVVGRAMLHLGIGAALGLGLGALLLQMKRMFVFRVPSGEPWVLPAVAVAMAAAGTLASWLPASRALRIPPTEALRSE